MATGCRLPCLPAHRARICAWRHTRQTGLRKLTVGFVLPYAPACYGQHVSLEPFSQLETVAAPEAAPVVRQSNLVIHTALSAVCIDASPSQAWLVDTVLGIVIMDEIGLAGVASPQVLARQAVLQGTTW